MTTRLYIHAGMQKAGSKAIQALCAEAAESLAEAGFKYADTGRHGNWHRGIFEDLSGFAQPLLAEAGDCGRALIISYEEMYLWSGGEIRRLAALFDKVRVLLVRRDFTSWVNSFVNQMIKAHRVSFADIERLLSKPDELAQRGDLDDHARRWRSALGAQAVEVVNFPRGEGDIRHEFCRWLDLSIDIPPTPNANPAADIGSLAVMYEVKRLAAGQTPDMLVAAMAQAHAVLGDRWIDTRVVNGPLVVSADQCQDLRRAVADDTVARRLRLPTQIADPSQEVRELASKVLAEVAGASA